MNQSLEILRSQLGSELSKTPSPLMRWLNPTLLSAEAGQLKLRFLIRNEMTNPLGNIHGGISAAIIDDAIGTAVFSLGENHFYASINNVIDYFSAAKEGEYVIAVTSILKNGKQLVNAQCEIWNDDQSRMIAKGVSNLIKTNFAH